MIDATSDLCDICSKPRWQKLGAMSAARCLCAYGDLVQAALCPACGGEVVSLAGEYVTECPYCHEILFVVS